MENYAVKIAETGKQKNHETYIDNIKAGDIVAFKISENVAVSAKVYHIVINYRREVTDVMCVTKKRNYIPSSPQCYPLGQNRRTVAAVCYGFV